MIKVIFPTGEEKEFGPGTSVLEALKVHDKGLLKKTVAAKVDGSLRDLKSSLGSADGQVKVEPVVLDSPEGLEILRHSASHVLAEAVKSIYKDAKVAIGPAIEDGFYYDFDVEKPFTPEDLEKIESRMREIIKGDHPFSRETIRKEEALKLFLDMGERYKEEIIGELDSPEVSVYRQSQFVDLCRGPHLPSTGWIKAFKLTAAAGAYWRGDEKQKMLQRIYGTAFATRDDLKAYLDRIEEAKRRDHRKLGRELDLFTTSENIGSGLVLWHPNGATVRMVIEDFWKGEHVKGDYSIIYTPHIAMVDLWKTSGHWDFYKESLFSPMDVEGQDYIVKPMNCPFHIQVYKTQLRSYRDLPIRYAELGTVYRYERSGALHGLLRVRGFTQDDAHIFMTPDQLEDEIKGVLKFTLFILNSFGFNEFDIYLSTRPEKYVGTLDNWAKAEGALKGALEAQGIKYSIDPGEGVFYGPKIDIKIKDVLGRSWQCSTIQVDFNLPERFDITYRDESGGESRPIMIHRALMGSLERFFGCLVEHYAGAFPVWLSPVQATVLTVTERNDEFAREVYARLRSEGIRAEIDIRNEKLGFKVREAQLKKIPYQLVIGDKETEARQVAPRLRGGSNLPSMTVDEFLTVIKAENRPGVHTL
ncbi:MAG TPA: threonine--tRNA ligase [Deltaproteobacteria bacterium]|nr:MAG: threonine--tRNA ligase [Deltaproteobacteria bacterium GWA2_55_82]OGQ63900.1 MAG: threonine--tRNA ligase [Deltaproteobacteria bacterium RIFCSPLOWO2_02_FULL_55_12]OIJ72683.1 MAG: threonine--tRNA ligase [Deltaproteobacteria bacterium GWC2_55_46]HBG47593.1 threonine--tRNA ligase [Deltaproteobacteria bacterium]HCY10504.1 threonine--tRNA ligase [Deltaproteobacteria bacterium]